MSFKILSVCLFVVGLATTAMAASSGGSGGGDRGGLGDSPDAGDNNYRSSITQRGDTDDADEKDPNACWTLPRSADGKSIVAPNQAKPVVPRKCD